MEIHPAFSGHFFFWVLQSCSRQPQYTLALMAMGPRSGGKNKNGEKKKILKFPSLSTQKLKDFQTVAVISKAEELPPF